MLHCKRNQLQEQHFRKQEHTNSERDTQSTHGLASMYAQQKQHNLILPGELNMLQRGNMVTAPKKEISVEEKENHITFKVKAKREAT